MLLPHREYTGSRRPESRDPADLHGGVPAREPAPRAMDALPPMFRALLTTTHDRHEDMVALVRGLPGEALAWSPADDAPALAGLALHILDVERYLLSVAVGEDIGWRGERGTHIEDVATEHELVGAIQETDRSLVEAFSALTDERLAAEAPIDGITVGEAIVEDLDHVAMHHGQMQLTRHLYEAAHPDAPATYEHWG